ncbi:hypothetical protein F0562_034214 [Nyssa sinensis]|uniref:Uncharacterized protein n=1 Tax=Nyssa sinensis TaxID=561372 RepID=A0A5J5AJ08_9ASTE|nr:hypothetical protein F0562_034214 [Nyssa sinensis]
MTGNPTTLHDVRKYDGEQHIQIADGGTLPITAFDVTALSFIHAYELRHRFYTEGKNENNAQSGTILHCFEHCNHRSILLKSHRLQHNNSKLIPFHGTFTVDRSPKNTLQYFIYCC